MKRTLLTLSAAVAVAAGCAAIANAAPTAAPKPAAAAQKQASSKDACASKPSKWQQYECENYTHSAPGDEYFGRMKMSYLGINNTFHDEAIRAGDSTTDPAIIGKVGFADEALQAWAHRYPHDPQLARSYFLAIQMYKKIYTLPAQQKAWTYMQTIVHVFPTSYFGKIVKTNMTKGFTEHYYADAQVCASPMPGASATAAATPDETPTAKPGQPKVDIITPPCVPPATAAPETMPSGSAAPGATAPSGSPAPTATRKP